MTEASPPVNQVEWRHYAQNTSALYDLVTRASVLYFKSAKYREHAGFYECVAHNSMLDSFGVARVGHAQIRVELNVRFMPQMSVTVKKVAANLSTTWPVASIACMTMANPQPEFKWYKNGLKLSLNSSKYTTGGVTARSKNLYESTLFIRDLDARNDLNKVYKCEAFNPLGLNKLEVELVPLSTPEKPAELRVLHVDFMTVALAWSAGFDGGFEQTFTIEINDTQFDIDSNETAASNYMQHTRYGPTRLNLTYLHADTAYSIRLLGKNRLGAGEWSDYLTVKTLPVSQNDTRFLPVFDTLFLNVPKNRFEFTMLSGGSDENVTMPLVCLKITVVDSLLDKLLGFATCLPFSKADMTQRQFSFDSLNENELSMTEQVELMLNATSGVEKAYAFKASQVKSIKVATCFLIKSDVCTSPATNAIIGNFFKRFYLLLNVYL